MNPVKIFEINALDDQRLDPYRDLRKTNVSRWSNWLIAEGILVTERLFQSGWEINSVLLSDKRFDRMIGLVPKETTVYRLLHSLCSQLVGFDFHAGVMACATRRVATIDTVVSPQRSPDKAAPSLLLCCPHTVLPDNLGSIIRLAAAFGCDGLIVGPQSADPFSRRSVRVSMGNVFQVPILQPRDLLACLRRLRDKFGYRLLAGQQTSQAVDCRNFQLASRSILLVGNEYAGLDKKWLELCQHALEIPLVATVDSLNVTNAVAILLYELRHQLDRMRMEIRR